MLGDERDYRVHSWDGVRVWKCVAVEVSRTMLYRTDVFVMYRVRSISNETVGAFSRYVFVPRAMADRRVVRNARKCGLRPLEPNDVQTEETRWSLSAETLPVAGCRSALRLV